MANQEHLEILRAGVTKWNKWREEHHLITPDLQEASLITAELEGANLTMSNLKGSKLTEANLKGAKLEGANLVEANLEGAKLIYANLERANLVFANFERAELIEAKLMQANLDGANLLMANLLMANLKGAVLTDANLRGTVLCGANLEKTNVIGVKYDRCTRYKGAQMDSCYGNARFKRFASDQQFIEEFRESKWRWPFYFIWLVSSDCGRSLLLWTVWSAAAAIFFGFKFFSMGQAHFEVTKLPWGLESMMYYSIVTFTTLGYGDIHPKTIEAAHWVTAEVIIGYVMLGGMISILATKLARRS